MIEMKDDSSSNDTSSASWRVYVPGVYSSGPPLRPAPVEVTAADVGVPPQLRNREALAGFILGIVGLVLCAGRIFGIPVLGPLFLVCGFPVGLVGVIVSAVGCRLKVRRSKALWGLLFSCVAFILFAIFTFIVPPTRAEIQGSGSIIGIVLLIIEGVFFGGFGAVLLYAGSKSWWERLHMRWRGVMVEGFITDRRTETTYSKRGNPLVSYHMTYDYRYAGEMYSHKQRVGKRQYQRLERGSRVAVRCLPRRPKVALLAKEERSFTEIVLRLLLFLFGAGMLSFSLFLIIITLRTYPWGS